MVEKWKETLDKCKLGGAVLADLSKVFDCIKNDLLIAKLAAYGFDSYSVTLTKENKEQKYIIPTAPTLI